MISHFDDATNRSIVPFERYRDLKKIQPQRDYAGNDVIKENNNIPLAELLTSLLFSLPQEMKPNYRGPWG